MGDTSQRVSQSSSFSGQLPGPATHARLQQSATAKSPFSQTSELSNPPIVVIEVTLRPQATSKLVIKQNDDLQQVVDSFCLTHGLSGRKKGKLMEVAGQ